MPSSLSPCYPEPYEWGTAITPPSPRGWYRTLYQAFDALHRTRIYPATLLQCAGRIARRDYWMEDDLSLALTYVFGGQIAPCTERILPGGIDFQTTVAQLFATPTGCPGTTWRWYWTMVFDNSRSEKWNGLQFLCAASSRVWRLRDFATWPVPGSPYDALVPITSGLVISSGDYLGEPWTNAI